MMLTPYTFAVAIAPIPPARAMPEPTLSVKTAARPTTRSNLLIISSLLFDALARWFTCGRLGTGSRTPYTQSTFQGCFARCPKRKLRWGVDLARSSPAILGRTLKKGARLTRAVRRSDSQPLALIERGAIDDLIGRQTGRRHSRSLGG